MLTMILTTMTLGCGSRPLADSESVQETRAVLKIVGIEYGNYLAAHHGVPPQDERALRAFLQTRLKDLEHNNVTDVDQLLTSPRDKAPLKFFYGARIAPPTDPDTPWAAHEKVGDGDVRLAANSRGAVVAIPNDELAAHFLAR